MRELLEESIQNERIRKSNRLFAEKSLELGFIGEDGEQHQNDWNFGFREQIWAVTCLLASGDDAAVKRANLLLRTMQGHDTTCVFSCSAISRIVSACADKVEPDNFEFLKAYVKLHRDEMLDEKMGFVGVNDNFPCMNLCGALLYYKLFGDNELLDVASRRAHQLKGLLTARGTVSEFASPTYTAFQINALANAVNRLDDCELRELLLDCEERLWFDVMSRYCAAASTMAGPFSRTSHIDSEAHTHTIRPLYYAVLGDEMNIRPQDTYFTLPEGQLPESDANFPIYVGIAASYIQNAVYHVPKYCLDIAKSRRLPAVFKTTYEVSSSNDVGHFSQYYDPMQTDDTYEYQAGSGYTTPYITDTDSLGTATREFHNGVQTDAFHCIYRTELGSHSEQYLKSIYTRYLVNDTPPDTSGGLVMDRGRKLAISDSSSALVLYKPKTTETENVTGLKLSLLMYAGYSLPEEIFIGNEKIDVASLRTSPIHISKTAPIFIRDGQIYICVTPLISEQYLPSGEIELELYHRYLMLSFVNYRGEPRNFSKNGIQLIGNGFGFEIEPASGYADFGEFRRCFAEPVVIDEYISNEHSRYTSMRRVYYRNTKSSLEIQYSPVSEGIKHLLINGKPEAFDRIESSDFDTKLLPFIK